MDELRSQLQAIFCDAFDDAVQIDDETSAGDVEGWDSLMHINLIIAIEKRFGVKFATAEIGALKEDGQTVGALLQLVASKLDGVR